jgi:multisubunit Na+/H+ antiporter MnhB subunit
MFGTGIWFMKEKTPSAPGFTGGGAAAAVGILLVLALILEAPSLIMDDSPSAGGEPSTMRILTLAIVLVFCLLMLRTGWNSGTLPSLQDQGNWVWLVTAALGGKALQKFAEIQDKGKG